MNRSLLLPRHWLGWLAIGLLRLIVELPYPAVMAIGRGSGQFIRRLAGKRVRIADLNLRLCCRNLGKSERTDLIREHFAAIGMGLMEIAMARWWPRERQPPHPSSPPLHALSLNNCLLRMSSDIQSGLRTYLRLLWYIKPHGKIFAAGVVGKVVLAASGDHHRFVSGFDEVTGELDGPAFDPTCIQLRQYLNDSQCHPP